METVPPGNWISAHIDQMHDSGRYQAIQKAITVEVDNHPGFRAERMSASLIGQLEAKMNRGLQRFERMLDVCGRRKVSRR